MKHEIELKTPYGIIKATWELRGRMIEVCYGDRSKVAQASPNDATNLFVARDIVRKWVNDDLKSPVGD